MEFKDLDNPLPDARILFPRPRAQLPVYWAFDHDFPEECREPVVQGLRYVNRMAARKLFTDHPVPIEMLPNYGPGGVRVRLGAPGPGDEKAYAAVVADPTGRWAWCDLVIFPRWRRLSHWIFGLFRGLRQSSSVRHEGMHLVGMGHSRRRFSLMHPRFGWTWWLFGGRRLMSRERAALWRAYPRIPE